MIQLIFTYDYVYYCGSTPGGGSRVVFPENQVFQQADDDHPWSCNVILRQVNP